MFFNDRYAFIVLFSVFFYLCVPVSSVMATDHDKDTNKYLDSIKMEISGYKYHREKIITYCLDTIDKQDPKKKETHPEMWYKDLTACLYIETVSIARIMLGHKKGVELARNIAKILKESDALFMILYDGHWYCPCGPYIHYMVASETYDIMLTLFQSVLLQMGIHGFTKEPPVRKK